MKQAENRSARQVTLHLTLPILVTLTLLTAAFSTGSPVFLMPALLIALLCLSGIYGVFRASATLEVSVPVLSCVFSINFCFDFTFLQQIGRASCRERV